MIHRFIARLIGVIHTAYVAFVLFGSLLVLRWPGLMLFQMGAVVWAFGTLAFDLGCPLTPWEKTQWRMGGVEPYPEGFLQHHVLRARFPIESARRNHIALGAFALLLNLAIYSIILRSR